MEPPYLEIANIDPKYARNRLEPTSEDAVLVPKLLLSFLGSLL